MDGNQKRTGVDFREVRMVLAVGAVGGFFSWIYAETVGQSMEMVAWKAIPVSVLFGTAAAFIGVYLLANVDTSAFLRALAFAFLCGFLWMPVFDAGRALIFQDIRIKNAVEAGKASAEARSQLQALKEVAADAAQPGHHVAPEVLEERTRAAAEATVAAMRAAEQVDAPALNADIVRQSQTVIQSIQQVKRANPRVGAQAEKLLRSEGLRFRTVTRTPPEEPTDRDRPRRPR